MVMRRKKNNVSTRRQRRELDIDKMLSQSSPAFESFHVEEPKLVFARNLSSVDPKTGIDQFGPFSTVNSIIRIGIVGTGSGIDAFRSYLENAKTNIQPGLNARGKHYDSICFPDFPGIDQASTFRVDFVTDSSIQKPIPREYFEHAVKTGDVSSKIRLVVELIAKELEALAETEPGPNVVAVVLPDVVERECATVGQSFRVGKLILTPTEKYHRKLERQFRRTGQYYLSFDFGDSPVEGQKGFWNIHHALKAHAMKFALPTQLVWEGRLSGQGLTQDPASMAWNLFTALYYKAGNIPWQPFHIPPNTCFVGISFYKENPNESSDIQTSLAQVFSGAGEGLVLKGQKAVLDKKRDKRAHLDESGAENLLRQALDLYVGGSDRGRPGYPGFEAFLCTLRFDIVDILSADSFPKITN